MTQDIDRWLDGFTGTSKPSEGETAPMHEIVREEVLRIHSQSEAIKLRSLSAREAQPAAPEKRQAFRRRPRWAVALAASVCLSVLAGWLVLGLQIPRDDTSGAFRIPEGERGTQAPVSTRVLRGYAGAYTVEGQSIAAAEKELKDLGLDVARSGTAPQSVLLVTVQNTQIDVFRQWAKQIDAAPEITGTYLLEFMP